MMNDWNNARVFVDTNILFYALDNDAGRKKQLASQAVTQLWSSKNGVISTQVLSEWTVNLHRKLNMQWQNIEKIILPYLNWTVVYLEPLDTIEAIRIAQKNSLSYWDSQIVCAAIKANASYLLSEDLNHGQKIEGIKVVNPFF
jgi:predicted nucleic acid-binding protein